MHPGGLEVSVKIVSLDGRGHSSYLCYDVYVERCTSEDRETIEENVRQPIYMITKRGDAFIAFRKPRMDGTILSKIEHLQKYDKGPLPYFTDSEHLPFYAMPERERLEDPWRGGPNSEPENESGDDGMQDEGGDEDDGTTVDTAVPHNREVTNTCSSDGEAVS